MIKLSNIKKIYTENPFIDELLYYVKLLAYGSVVKIEKEADDNETETSLTNAELYLLTLEGNGAYELYNYTVDILKQSSVPVNLIVCIAI